MKHAFTLVYRLSPEDDCIDALAERLGAAGCTDTLVGFGQPGWMAIDFLRAASSERAAVLSALEDIQRVAPSARLEEASPAHADQLAREMGLLKHAASRYH
jgi:hypothetical protein